MVVSTDNTRAKRGTCRLKILNGKYAIELPKALFNGDLKRIFTGLEANDDNRALAESKQRGIQNDIDLSNFDYTLERYKPQYKKQSYLEAVAEIRPKTTLLDLWQKFINYQRQNWTESHFYYIEKTITPLVIKAPQNPYKALEIREWLLCNTTEGMTKRSLTLINQCFNWGLKHKLLKGLNPFIDMAKELKQPYERDGAKPRAFTPYQKQLILDAFKNHHGNDIANSDKKRGYGYSYYYEFVRFLFLTGCRPSEAIGLTWQKIDPQYRWIEFSGGIVQRAGKMFRTTKSKNRKSRKFPINQELRELLVSLRKGQNGEALVFPSPKGEAIRYNNFCKRAWTNLVTPILPGTTPYNCRDTFESEQILKGINPEIVARWCDSSPEMIRTFYFDSSIVDIVPK